MKKGIIISVIILIIATIGINIFIPNQLTASNVELVHVRESSALRYLSNKYQWAKWWTAMNPNARNTLSDTNNIFNYNRDIYEVKDNKLTGADITIYHQQKTVESSINLFTTGKDSIALQWSFNIETSYNPIKKIIDYNQALAIKKNMADVLVQLKFFLEKNRNIYGVAVQHDTIRDNLLMSEKSTFKNYPTPTDIYKMIDELKKYVTSQGVISEGNTMLNVTVLNKDTYQTMVAIPINKELLNSGKMLLKHIVPGTPILVSQVNGGHYATDNALLQLENYKQDYQKSSPAIPYQLLITDRSKEADTTKWITKVCYPLFPW